MQTSLKNGLSLGETYINDKGCHVFVEAIDGVMKEDESQQVNKQRFISVVADSGTNTSNKDLELVYVRFLENDLPVNKYAAVVELKKADANGVIASINTGMVEFGLENWKSQTVAFGSDGDSVYVGRLNGVVAKLHVEIPWLLGEHCIAHRLELSVLDALKYEEQLKNVQEMLQGLYKHYHYSPKALRELKELAQLLDEKINKPVKLRGTRWLPHMSWALTVMIKSFSVIYAHFENTISENTSSVEMRGRARNTVNVLRNFRNLLFIHLMLDVLAVFKALSLLFQRDNIVISAAKDGLYSTEQQLRAMIARPGKNLQDFLDEVGDGHIYKGVTLKRMPSDLNAFIRDKQRMINTIIQFLNSRFESLDSDPVLAAGKTFDHRVWPESVEDLAAYGEAEVDCLVQHFRPAWEGNDFDFTAVAGEWSALKACVTANNFRHLDPLILWQRIFTAFKDQFPNILMLVEIILILPLATATVERGFQQ